jgi:hypothetical protein
MFLYEAITGISLNEISHYLSFNFIVTFLTLSFQPVTDTCCYSHVSDFVATVMKYSKVKHWYNKHRIPRCFKVTA